MTKIFIYILALFGAREVLYSQNDILKYLKTDNFKEFRIKYSNDSIAIDKLFRFRLHKIIPKDLLWYSSYDINNGFQRAEISTYHCFWQSAGLEIKACYWLKCIYLERIPESKVHCNINYLVDENNNEVYDYDVKSHNEVKKLHYRAIQALNNGNLRFKLEFKFKKTATQEYKILRSRLKTWYTLFLKTGLQNLRCTQTIPLENYSLKFYTIPRILCPPEPDVKSK